MLRVLVFPTLARESILSSLAVLPGVEARCVEPGEIEPEDLKEAAVLVLPAPLWSADLAERVRLYAPALRLVQLVSAGYEELTLHGVPVSTAVANAGDCWAGAVAEHGMALMLALARRVPQLLQSANERTWDRSLIQEMRTLNGASLLLVGFGNIGREVAGRAQAFGMHVIAATRSPERHKEAPLARLVPLAELHTHVREADFIFACLPASISTRGLLNAAFFDSCKRGAIFINVGRGDVTDTSALVRTLQSGRLGGAGLDVTDPEPLPPRHALWSAPNVLISPHVAIGGNEASLQHVADMVADNLTRLQLGQRLRNSVQLELTAKAV